MQVAFRSQVVVGNSCSGRCFLCLLHGCALVDGSLGEGDSGGRGCRRRFREQGSEDWVHYDRRGQRGFFLLEKPPGVLWQAKPDRGAEVASSQDCGSVGISHHGGRSQRGARQSLRLGGQGTAKHIGGFSRGRRSHRGTIVHPEFSQVPHALVDLDVERVRGAIEERRVGGGMLGPDFSLCSRSLRRPSRGPNVRKRTSTDGRRQGSVVNVGVLSSTTQDARIREVGFLCTPDLESHSQYPS